MNPKGCLKHPNKSGLIKYNQGSKEQIKSKTPIAYDDKKLGLLIAQEQILSSIADLVLLGKRIVLICYLMAIKKGLSNTPLGRELHCVSTTVGKTLLRSNPWWPRFPFL